MTALDVFKQRRIPILILAVIVLGLIIWGVRGCRPHGPQQYGAGLHLTATSSGINLTWSVPAPTGTQTQPVSANIYRGISTSGTGNCPNVGYARIATGAPTNGPYLDPIGGLTPGTTYCYYVTTVDSGGNESIGTPDYAGVAVPAATNCTVTTPCASLSLTSSSMGATVVTDPATGLQKQGPGNAIFWSCMGGSTGCSQTNLTSAAAALAQGQTVNSTWEYSTFPMSTGTVTYKDQQPYASLMNYAWATQWTSANKPIGQAAGPLSAIAVYTMPQPPPTTSVPAAPSTPVVTLDTSGAAVGPQKAPTRAQMEHIDETPLHLTGFVVWDGGL